MKPLPSDKLFLYLTMSEKAASSVLIREDSGQQHPVYYTSKSLTDVETRYPCIDKLAITLMTLAQCLRPYFRAHHVTVLTNFLLRQVFHKLETSGKLMKWALELSEDDIGFEPRIAMKG